MTGETAPAQATVELSRALVLAKRRAVRLSRAKTQKQVSRRATPIAFIYLRVSTKEQARTGGGAEGYSIPAQRIACLAKADQLGAVVHRIYIDAGESARSADRDELQAMLKDVKAVKPDYVIVHKIDRLARNREDDIAINLLLRRNHAELVSCTENIDNTPSGKLLYGLLAEIAQFYSGNLAQEVMKGLLRKAEEGGTPFRAPTGYLNVRKTVEGVTFSTIDLDPERAELMRWCLEQYATGDWSAADLLLEATARGLTSRPTATKPARPVGLTTFYHMLQNPYYMGIVSYQGIHYEGKHQPLIEPETWLAIQDILAAHAHLGEKDRKHTHYLRSTIFCNDCGGRLVYSINVGNGGPYTYYVCVKKKTKTNNCRRPAVRLERIEEGIARFYERFEVSAAHVEQIRAGVRALMTADREEARRHAAAAVKRKQQATDERQKLLRAHYAGHIPEDVLGSEMQRLTRALTEADALISAAQTSTAEVEATLEAALAAAGRCHRAYVTAPEAIRRQINQGFFVKLFIGQDGSVARAELTEPFAALLSPDLSARMANGRSNGHGTATTAAQRPADAPNGAPEQGHTDANRSHCPKTESDDCVTPSEIFSFANGVQDECMVPPTGFEPALGRF
ncbi:recombinase family protein [Amycolatopsis sp. cmx-4-68]|uniref:recombinase family protein n=1 Tax=Amycolatopsis sp. cmx-4-68 TaxID=2790938 RepID=UPI00397D80FB